MSFNTKLTDLLRTNPIFVDDEGDLLLAAVQDRAWKLDHDLIRLLLSDNEMKETFFDVVEGSLLFNTNTFIEYISQKNFLDNSFTRYRNRIGLTIDERYLSERGEVSLAWAYKDCVLEGGQTKEEEKRKEIFFNEVLAQDEINRMFDPKVLTNFICYNTAGSQPFREFNRDQKGVIKDNLIVKGNNLITLHTLKGQFREKVQLIYIDPPYYFSDNKSGDSFQYNSNFKLSSWCTFMKNRLAIARDFLAPEGTIFVQISDEGFSHIKLILDDIFGQENFLNIISVRMKNIAGASGGGEDKRLKKNVEFILVYCKSKDTFSSFKNVYENIELMEFIQSYKDNQISWKYTSVLFFEGNKEYLSSTKDGAGEEIKIFRRRNPIFKSISQLAREENLTEKEVYYKYINKIFSTAMPQSSIRPRVMSVIKSKNCNDDFYSIEYVPKSGRYKGVTHEQFYKGSNLRLLSWLRDVSFEKDGKIYKKELQGTYWDGFNLNNLSKEGQVELENGKKPEALLERIIDMSTNNNDLVMDFFLGSGTSCAVAHKMQRQYIGIEQLNYGDNSAKFRLMNVIQGDKSGISNSVDWIGGGDFIYCELMKYNQAFVERIQKTNTSEALLQIWQDMAENSFLNWYVNPKLPVDAINDFIEIGNEENGLAKQKKLLIELLDKNQLYVNLSEIDDAKFNVSEEDKALNKAFYGEN